MRSKATQRDEPKGRVSDCIERCKRGGKLHKHYITAVNDGKKKIEKTLNLLSAVFPVVFKDLVGLSAKSQVFI